MVRSISIMLAVVFGLAAVEASAEAVPKPKPRPERLEAQSPDAFPIPRPRPGAAQPAPEKPRGGADQGEGGSWASATIAAAQERCAALLQGLDIIYEAQAPLGREGGCGAPAPVLVSRVAGIALTPPAVLTCPMAASLHDWLASSVKPAARKRLKTEVTEIHAAASYVCRRRNNASGGKLSEHGRANALDISGFSFARKESVAVGGGSWGAGIFKALGLSGDGSFLGDIREAACDHFTTVLGPGSDPYHGDHFHVDALERRGGYRICK